MDKRVEITASDLPIDNLLDQYYTFLKRVVAGTTKNVYLFNTITPFDVYKISPLYNENVFANHADIVIGTSPGIVDESQGISLNDSFSRYYTDTVNLATRKVEKKFLTPEQRTEIKSKETDIDAERAKAWKLDEQLAEQWQKHSVSLGLKPGTFEYDLEKINFYTNSGLGTQLADIASKILGLLADIQDIQESTIPADYLTLIKISHVLRSKEYKMYRPFRPQLEESGVVTHWDLAKLLASARNMIGLKDIVEENEQILPFADLKIMFADAARGFTIKKGVTDVESHDKDWSVSGSGSKFGIFKASASASYVEHIEQSVKSINEVAFNFKAIHDIRVNRRDWYDTSIFELDVVKETLDQNKKLARNTRYAITSLVLGRGLSVGFKFDEKTHYEKMTDFKSSISGGATIGFVSFGLSGQYHQHDFKQINSAQEKSITFADDDSVCRVLAIRYDQIHNVGSEADFFQAFNYEARFDVSTKTFVPLRLHVDESK